MKKLASILIWDNIVETRGRRGRGKRVQNGPGGVGFSDLGKDCIIYAWLLAVGIVKQLSDNYDYVN